ncbi:YjcZ family sporulation protein [Solibacillus sp. CAU 1738]
MGNYDNENDNYGRRNNSAFALIVVLFILLIIVGASFMY